MTEKSRNPLDSVFTGCATLRTNAFRELFPNYRPYIIIIIPRSGSTWLTEQARLSDRLGTPQEWFNEEFILGHEYVLDCPPPKALQINDINTYLQHSLRATASPEGNTGLQLSRSHMEWLCEATDNPAKLFRGMPFFYLRRRNLVAQAISLYRSAESGYYHSYQPEAKRRAFDSTSYDPDKIQDTVTFLQRNEIWFEWMLQRLGITPYRFTYEDLLHDMPTTLSWMYQTLTGKALPATATRNGAVSRLADGRSAEWEVKFRESRADYMAGCEAARPPFRTDTRLSHLLFR